MIQLTFLYLINCLGFKLANNVCSNNYIHLVILGVYAIDDSVGLYMTTKQLQHEL